jgi:hypothetical protein
VRPRLLTAAASLALLLAATAPAAHAKTVTCPVSSATVLFWPTGHKAIGSVGFPKIPTPHLEVYKTGSRYPGANFLLYADYTGGVDSSRSLCQAARGSIPPKVAHAKSTRARKALVCPGIPGVSLTTTKSKGKLVVRGQTPALRLFDITLRKKTKTTSSSMTYDSSMCHLTATPS